MIELGDKLNDPYTVENMTRALESAYPSKAGVVTVPTTDMYVRFLPRTDAELDLLRQSGIYLMDHPMDYRIVKEGDYYHDPLLEDDMITWQYAVVDKDYAFPEGIQWQLLDNCYISEHDPDTRASGIDWTLVEKESFRLTGNEDLWVPPTKGPSAMPAGRITMSDPGFCNGRPVGVSGVMVACNVFVKIALTYTDRDGYYQMPLSFSADPRYRLVFQNSKGFSVGFNLVLLPASVSTLGSGGPSGIDINITEKSDDALMRRVAVNNAAYDYISRCTPQDLEISVPPADLRIWIIPLLEDSAAPMLHHGAGLDNELIKQYAGNYTTLIKLFLPDITIGTMRNESFAGIYGATVHEMAHASHYANVGNDFWTPYVTYVVTSFLMDGGAAYGYGAGEGSGHCEVGEMWAYFLGATLEKDRYGGSLPAFPEYLWFRPEILSCMYERGVSRSQIFKALKPKVTSVDDLKDELVSLYPDMEHLILQCFERYGK